MQDVKGGGNNGERMPAGICAGEGRLLSLRILGGGGRGRLPFSQETG